MLKQKPKPPKRSNGKGSVTLRKDANRAKPYMVRTWVDGVGQTYIGDAESYEDGLLMLADFGNHPERYLKSYKQATFAQIYNLVCDETFKGRELDDTTIANYQSSFKHCRLIWDKPISALRTADLQQVITDTRDSGGNHDAQKKVRTVMHHCYNYAIKFGILGSDAVDYSQYVTIDKHKRKYPKTPFNTRQLNRVRAVADDVTHPLSRWAMCVVMMCYAGTRPSEFAGVLKKDVSLKRRIFKIGKSKTESSSNRIIPISKRTLPYFEFWMQQPGSHLIMLDDVTPINYRLLFARFKKVMQVTHCKHTPHECRHTLATWLDNTKANPHCVKLILGHAEKDITKGVYTHKTIAQLRKTIDLLL